jgi:hypothetical protein
MDRVRHGSNASLAHAYAHARALTHIRRQETAERERIRGGGGEGEGGMEREGERTRARERGRERIAERELHPVTRKLGSFPSSGGSTGHGPGTVPGAEPGSVRPHDFDAHWQGICHGRGRCRAGARRRRARECGQSRFAAGPRRGRPRAGQAEGLAQACAGPDSE